jgi:NodT family efflux transporter outer membrane factor (OMF) lipoprotein
MRSVLAPVRFVRSIGVSCGARARLVPGRLMAMAPAIAGLGALAACAVGPDYREPDTPMPANYATSGSRSAVDLAQWWRSLKDRELDSLIERAIADSPTLEAALDRLQQARAQEAAIVGTALPAVIGSEGGGRGTGSDISRGRAVQALGSADSTTGLKQINNVAGFAAGWEIDLFGKYRRAIEAAQYDIETAAAARNLVLISLVADVTRAYLDLRALQSQLAVLRKNIAVAHRYVDFVQERFQRGITNELDVTLAQRQEAQLQAEGAPLIAQINAARYAIAALIGVYPEGLSQELGRPGPLPALPARIRPGLPIDLLRRRPDIVEAERQLASATAAIGIATAALFPSVSVVGSYGSQAQGLGVNPVAVSSIWSVGPSVTAPILDFGTLDALVEKADYRTREYLATYRQTILNAVRDVDVAVEAYHAQQARLRYLRDALVAARRAVDIAQQRFDRGLIDSLNVIDALRQQYDLEEQYVQAQQAAADQFVTLYRSLGGGWENYQNIPAIDHPLPAIAAAVKRAIEPVPPPQP